MQQVALCPESMRADEANSKNGIEYIKKFSLSSEKKPEWKNGTRRDYNMDNFFPTRITKY